jgi:hypothetical protein
MKSLSIHLCLALAGIFCADVARAVDTSDDRLTFSANGSTLTDTNGGGGGAVGWLHNFSADTIFGAAGEYQKIADAHWAFGSLNGSITSGEPDGRLSVYGEIHEGSGNTGTHDFKYAIEALGVIRTFAHRFSAQLEDKQINIDTQHGNLPKIGGSVLWSPTLSTAVAYQRSVDGNLGTSLGSVRIDLYSKYLNWLAGGAFGKGSPAVLNLTTGLFQPGSTLREEFLGISRSVGHGDLSLVADYVDLGGSKKATLTLSYIVDLRPPGQAK